MVGRRAGVRRGTALTFLHQDGTNVLPRPIQGCKRLTRIPPFDCSRLMIPPSLDSIPPSVTFGDRRKPTACQNHAFPRDRKSTRLNSSHGYISYAVFCLKKKKCRTYHAARDRASRPGRLAILHRPTRALPPQPRTCWGRAKRADSAWQDSRTCHRHATFV